MTGAEPVESYDYVIAGGGSAGCTLAARLSEQSDLRVLLIEAGGSGNSLFTRMPAGNGFLMSNPQFDWTFMSTPQAGMNGGQVYYPRGLGLGGSSLLNGMIYIRGNPKDYDLWADSGLKGYGFADLLPYFKRASAAPHRVGDPYHGQSGPMKLTPARNHIALCQAFVEACVEAGAPINPDFNGSRQLGAGRLDAKVFDGRRQSTNEAYLSRKPSNLTIKTHSRVLEVEFDGNRAAGLRLTSGRVRVEREVLLAAGSFQSPQILMLSGVGPADHLRGMGIEVRLDQPEVGANLYDHPNLPMQFSIRDANLSMSRYQRIDRAIWLGLRYLSNRSGPGGGPFWSSLLFHALRDPEWPELEVFFTPMVVKEEPDGAGLGIQRLLALGSSVFARGKTARPGYQFDVNLLRPRSHGSVRLASADPLAAPLIDPGYLRHEDDLRDLMAGVRHMREVAAQSSLSALTEAEISPGASIQSDRELEAAVRRLVVTGHHPVCTCRMGADEQSVIDAEFRVRGLEGLRVIDGSSLPTQINGNVNAPIIMMAEKAADIILGREPLPREDPRVAA